MKTEMKPMVLVFAGPNGSGKSTITSMVTPVGEYINADDIKKILRVSDLEAAQIAEKKRNLCISNYEKIFVPQIIEQQKIGSYFSHLDKLITASQKQLDGYKKAEAVYTSEDVCVGMFHG